MMLSQLVRVMILLLIVGLGACTSTPPSETSGEFLNNSMITARIKSKLVDDPLTGLFHISVISNKGVVRLLGKVKTRNEKQRAEVIAYSVSGVKKVDNSLKINPSE